MKELRLAVIGVGHLGRIHARLATRLDGVRLVGVADPVARSRDDVAAEVGAESFADYRDLLGQIDAAIVATPTRTHHEVAQTLLDHGVHLLVEKPLTATVAEADQLVETARRQGAILQVGHVERFNPALSRVLPHVADPKYIEAVRTSGYSFRSTDVGVVLDLMIHDLDVALALARSPVKTVEALGISILGEHEDTANARVTFESGCVANFTASRVSYTSERTMQIWSSRAFASVDFGLRRTTLVHPHEQVLQRTIKVDSLSPEMKHHLKHHLFDDLLSKETIDGAEGNAIADEQRDLVESIRYGREPRVTGEQARDCLALAEKILNRIATHRWDGTASGRIGPLAPADPAPTILRGPHWNLSPQTTPQREAQ